MASFSGWLALFGPAVLRRLGVEYPQRRVLELVEGPNVSIDVADNRVDAVSVTISSRGVVAGACTLEQFGAKGDGTTDDSAALSAASSALTAGTYSALILGAKTYLVGGVDPWPMGVAVIGQGPAATILKTTANAPVFLVHDTATASRNKLTSFASFSVVGNSTGANQNAIEVGYFGADGTTNLEITDVVAKNMGGRGFSWGYGGTIGMGPRVTNCKAISCGYGFYSADQANMVACQAINCGVGLTMGSGNVSWVGGDITGSTTKAVDILAGSNGGHGVLSGAQINHNAGPIAMVDIVHGFTIDACHIYQTPVSITGTTGVVTFSNCEMDPAGYTIGVTGSTSRVRFIDCTFETAYFTAFAQDAASDVEFVRPMMFDTGAVPSFAGALMRLAYAFPSDADQTLTIKQSRAAVIDIAAGVVTATRKITSARAAAAGESVVVINRTGQTINFFWAGGGSGIAIPTNNTAVVDSDGTNAVCRTLASNAASVVAGALNPATLALSGFYRGSYSASPWAGVASAGASGGRSISAGSAPSTGTAINGFTPAQFNGSQWLRDLTNLASAYLSTTAYRVSMLIKPTSLSAPAGAIYNNPGLLTETGGNWGIVIDTSGVHVYHGSGAQVAHSSGAVSAGAWHRVDVVFDGTQVRVTVDGVAGTPVASATTGAIGSALTLGSNFGASVGFVGQIAEVDIASTALSGVTSADWSAYFLARYGV